MPVWCKVLMLCVLCCLAACATEPVKKTAPLKKEVQKQEAKPKKNQTAQQYTAWFVQTQALQTLHMGDAMRHTRVLEAKPCQIVDVYVESPTAKKSSALTDVTFDEKSRLIRVLKKSRSATQTTVLKYSQGRLVFVELKDVSSTRTWIATSRFVYDEHGALSQQVSSIDGAVRFTTKFTYDDANRTVNINKVYAKTGKSKSSQVSFDKQWRVKSRAGVAYTYAPDHINAKSKNISHDMFLKDGMTQTTKRVTNITVGETSTTWLSSGEMTYQAGRLTRFKQAIHTKKKVADKVQASDSVHTKKLMYSCPES